MTICWEWGQFFRMHVALSVSPCFPEEFSRCLNAVESGLMPILVDKPTFFFSPPSLPLSAWSLSVSLSFHSFPPFFSLYPFFFFLPNNKYHKALSCPVHHARFRVNKHECLMVPVLNGLIPWAARQTIKQGGRRDIIRVKFLKIYSRGKWHFRERQEMG